jgi:hypothetical protein
MTAETQSGEVAAQVPTTAPPAFSTEGGIRLANGYTKLPNGVVLDREGKP